MNENKSSRTFASLAVSADGINGGQKLIVACHLVFIFLIQLFFVIVALITSQTNCSSRKQQNLGSDCTHLTAKEEKAGSMNLTVSHDARGHADQQVGNRDSLAVLVVLLVVDHCSLCFLSLMWLILWWRR